MNPNVHAHAKSGLSAVDSRSPATPPTCVREVMTTNVTTLSPHQTFGEAVCLMANRPFRHFLVVHPDGRLAGVISDRDLLRVLNRTPVWQTKMVGEFMSQETVTVRPETLLSDAVGEMLARRINCLPVIDDNRKVRGIITSTDLLAAFQKIQTSLERVSR